ncbi:zinc finger protein 394-like isoform X4 [Psammomys obesus]|uniref:zinc finger protein 394-like isoform X4 n=1 Tax=Psammomys obesus TaxID=48139 RepID=UPI002452B9E3|nr:zinc finger protein 394-like isoform X4 [Psammomys obesus]XP_055469121.1 zinc finger protein 394-like isoform X4 [Psammomys obesus]
MVAAVALKAEAEDPGDWRDPESSRRRFPWLRYRDVSGPEEALSRRPELCRRWLRPERRSKEQMLELLVLEQFLSLLPRRLRDPVRHRRPESARPAPVLPAGHHNQSRGWISHPGRMAAAGLRPPEQLVRGEHGGLWEHGHVGGWDSSTLPGFGTSLSWLPDCCMSASNTS